MNESKHPWIARFSVGAIMLALAFVGLVITDVSQTGTWNYWRIMVPIYALLALWLSHYLRKKNVGSKPVTLWHELVHWVGLILAVYLISGFVNMGIMDRFEAGLVVLTMLALTIFIAGVYIENSFLVIGVVLGLFTSGIAFFEEYLYSIILPIAIAGVGFLFYITFIRKKF